MDFTDPMILANAMIFHDNMVNLQTTDRTSPVYNIPPTTTNPHLYSEHPNFSTSGVATSGYSFPKPIQETLETPYSIENIITGREYVKIIMGMLGDDILLVSVLLTQPQASEIKKIRLFLKEQVHHFLSEQIRQVFYVISGEYTEEFKRLFLAKHKGTYQECDNKIIIKVSTK